MLESNARTIVIDSREQLPYEFATDSALGCLRVGDYSAAGYEDRISIERKTLDDLIGCLTVGRDRFERELDRGKSLTYFALVVEASLSDIINGRYRSKALPKAMIQSLLAFSIRYRLPIFFCENRKNAEQITESLLEKFVREQEKNDGVMECTPQN